MSYWGNRKPHFGLRCRIDWGHPLARGLNLVSLFNEGAGNTTELLTQQSAASTWVTRNGGICGTSLVNPVANYTLSTSARPPSVTVLCRLYTGELSGRAQVWVDARPTDGSYRTWVLRNNAQAATIYWGWNNEWDVLSGTVAAYTNHTSALTYNQSDGALVMYIDGVAVSSTTKTGNAIRNLGIYQTNGLTMGYGAAVYSVMDWTRALSAAEVAWLYSEPYAMIQAPEMPVFYSIPAAPPASAIAAIRYHYERLRMSA